MDFLAGLFIGLGLGAMGALYLAFRGGIWR